MSDLRWSILVLMAFACQSSGFLFCKPPPTPAYGSFHPVKKWYLVGSKVTFSCKDWYQLSGSTYTKCVIDWKTKKAVWKFPSPVCKPKTKKIQCPKLTNPNYGNVHVSGRNPGNIADYSCKKGFKLVGVVWRKCQDNGKWTGKAPTCKKVGQCPELTPPKNGDVQVSGRKKGDKADYSCDNGFKLIGAARRKCQGNGKWTGKAPTCKKIVIRCPNLRNPRNGKVDVSGQKPGDKAEYTCNNGFQLDGEATRTCQDNGKWTGKTPACKRVLCPRLTRPDNGKVRISGREPKDTAEYSCNNGFELDGEASRKCQNNGQWTGEAPTCQKKECPPLPPIDNGMIELFDTPDGPRAEYSCDKGFKRVGARVRHCRKGIWKGNTPTCIPR